MVRMDDETKLLIIKLDSYLSLALYRYGERWPDDMKREAEAVIAEARRVT